MNVHFNQAPINIKEGVHSVPANTKSVYIPSSHPQMNPESLHSFFHEKPVFMLLF